MKTFVVAFDVDGDLIGLDGKPRHDVIDLFRAFQALGAHMVIWSGSGVDYATQHAAKLGLNAEVVAKGSIKPDLAVDDMDVALAKANFQVNSPLLRSEGEFIYDPAEPDPDEEF